MTDSTSLTSHESGNLGDLPDSARRVALLLREQGHAKPVVMLPETGKTSAEAAAGLGCSVAQIAKSILFRRRDDDAPVLVIASGVNRVDEKKVAARVGAIGRADAKFVREKTGYAIGGVCPIGHATPPVTLIDADLLALDSLWAAAGHPHAVFNLSPQELVALTGAPVLSGNQVTLATAAQSAGTYAAVVSGVTRASDGEALTVASASFAGRPPFDVASAASASNVF